MKQYDVMVKFKNEPIVLEFSLGSDNDLKESIALGWEEDDIFRIGDYFLSVNDILWIKVGDGKPSEESSK